MAESSIEWTEHTWNPVTGYTKISPGCKHCYAETMSRHLKAIGAPGHANGFKLTLHPERLEQPLRRRAPTTYFVNSMSDLFQVGVACAQMMSGSACLSKISATAEYPAFESRSAAVA